jgi:hypothetical protein
MASSLPLSSTPIRDPGSPTSDSFQAVMIPVEESSASETSYSDSDGSYSDHSYDNASDEKGTKAQDFPGRKR